MLRIIFSISLPIFPFSMMKCSYSHDPLCICPFATNVSSNVLHLLFPVLHPQNCHGQTQIIHGILKLSACLPLL
jgi:hypothetical protein